MELKFKKIVDIYDKHDSYLKALSWDTKNTYSKDKDMEAGWLIQKMIGVYNENELIALGSIETYYDLDTKKMSAYLASIVDCRYRRQGIADRLLKEMLLYCKQLKIEIVKVNILKNNIPSILQIQKNNFDFVDQDEKTVTYQKKLINKK